MAGIARNSEGARPALRWTGTIALMTLLALTSTGVGQPSPPPVTRDGGILINPTLDECTRGWQRSDEAKWSREQFDQFCSVLKSPAPIAANPTVEDCNRGWNATSRWPQAQFQQLCSALNSSK